MHNILWRIILDEPTSALEANTRDKLISHLVSIKSDKIIILITHDEKLELFADTSISL